MAGADAELVKQLQAQLNARQLDADCLSSLVRQLEDQNDWCEAAGQSEPLTTRLKNLLKDYPADVGLFKEMVQNADDAGAGRVHFVWDTRKLAKQSLLTPEMAAWQTNCLWAYNDAIFTEQDFEAICRLGVGGKRGSSERIGRFGLGFNSVYNLTDLPSVLSQDMVLFLDPHVTHLARKGASSQKPGIKLRFLKANVLERFRDQFEPYQLLGCDMDASSSPFQGTLIRIPFRTKETAKKSEISSIVVNDEMMEALCQQFQQEAFQWLLFLQNVQEISMSVLKDGSASPQNLFTMSLASATAKLKRPSLVTDKSATRSTLMAKELEILCKGETSKVRRYYLFTDTQHGFRSRVCLAVPERTREQDGDEEGRVFCFLPLPRNIDLGLRLHVHAPLNMAQDRRSMLLDNRIGESEQELVRHNFALLDDLIPSALLACLKDLAVKRNQMPPGHFFALFPSLLHKGGALAPDRIAKSFYARLLDGSSFPLPVAAPAGRQTRVEAPPERWVKITEAVFVPAGNAAVEQVPQALLDSVVEALLRCGVPCVDAPPEVIDSFGRTEQRKPTILTPAWLRQHLRALGKGAPSHALDESSGTSIFAQLKPKDVADFLEFCLSDGLAADLQDVPLLMCEDETMVHAFSHKEKAVAALVPQSPLERRLFPNKDGRKLILASRLEARPLVWAKLKQMAAKWENPQAASVPSFQCKFVNFQLLTEALQRLLPRTWNDRVPKVAVTDYIEVQAAPVTADGFSAAALLRDLALSRPRWCDVLLQHIFPWALQSGSEVRQAVMRAVIYHWRDMELAGHGPCLEGLQRIPFVGTAGGQMVCAGQALEPTEQLRSLYPEKGPFPDAVWLSGECRALLRFRAALSYEELAERLGFLHHQEVKRREGGKEAPEVAPAVLQVAQALVRYVCENVSPAMEDESKTPKAPKSEGFWPFDFMTDTKEKKSEQKLSGDQLMSIQSKLKRCFWLPPLSAPGGWPPEAPWRGATSGLCCADEVRLASEEFLVGMVRPLIGLTSVRGGAARLPRRFLESLGLSEKPENGLLNEQLQRMEEWATSLPDAKREVHASWITRCLYDHIYPILLREAVIKEYVSDKTKRLWVPQGGFLPISRMARQSIEFPPYLVKAPAEWKEKVPDLWAKINTCFGVQDYSEALGCIAEAAGGELDLQSLDIAVRLVMAITDKLQQERAQSAPAAAGSKMDILMPTAESQLRPARECVFNNMTWLPEVETAHLNLGNYCLVHPKISHTVAHTCGCRGVSLVVAKDATEMHGADWCEAAGQSEPITTRLKNLLKDYPADVSMFKEMVQNADDAGATEVHIVWDWRQHRKQSLLTPDMDRWQGPGLWVYNDAQFTAKDFDSICRLGVGGKREQSRKIGRFGLGFNSVYNFTDLPSILSGDMVLFLDPHVHHLSAMGASVQKPGILLRFLKIKVLENFRDQFEPYHHLLGCDLSCGSPFEGTLIRVPFRAPEVAKASEVSNLQMDKAAAEVLISSFCKEAHQWLLFLQSVTRIRLSEIHEGSESTLHTLCEVKLAPDSIPSSPSPPEEAKEAKPQKRISAIGSDCVVANIAVHATTFAAAARESFLHYRLIGGADCGLAEQVCIALPLEAPAADAAFKTNLRKEEGRLFCFLPLPPSAVSLRLAAHVHAPLNTTQDRRSVLLDSRVGDNEIINTNVRLLDVRIPECIARCALDLSKTASPKAAAGPRRCVRFSDAVFVSQREAKTSAGGPKEGAALLDQVSASLARFGVPVVKVPLKILESFEQVLHPAKPRVLTPTWLRQFLRTMGSSESRKASPGFPLATGETETDSTEKRGQDASIPYLRVDEDVTSAAKEDFKSDLQQKPVKPDMTPVKETTLQTDKTKLLEAIKQTYGKSTAESITAILAQDEDEKPVPSQVHKAGRQLAKAQRNATKARDALHALDESWTAFETSINARYKEQCQAYSSSKQQWTEVLNKAMDDEKSATSQLHSLAAQIETRDDKLPSQDSTALSELPGLQLPPAPTPMEVQEDQDDDPIEPVTPAEAPDKPIQLEDKQNKSKKAKDRGPKEPPKKKPKADEKIKQSPLQFKQNAEPHKRERSRSASHNRYASLQKNGDEEEDEDEKQG
ncbi:unnamed protein product [Effrenium voratum]|nr:unnamed protein product [Effrenium voratum]